MQRRGEQARAELFAYVTPLIHHRREHPGDDLLSVLCSTEYEGVRLSDDELASFCSFLLAAGVETTDRALSSLFSLLWQHPDQWRLLAERRDLLKSACAEGLRLSPPVHALSRGVRADAELSGQNRSGWSSALARRNRPSAVTTSAETRLSEVSPALRTSQPIPPPRVKPAIAGGRDEPAGHREPEGRRFVVEVLPEIAGLGDHALALGVDPDPLHGPTGRGPGRRPPWRSPGMLCPPPRIASGRFSLRANCTPLITSAIPAARTMSAGRRSCAAFQIDRASSYPRLVARADPRARTGRARPAWPRPTPPAGAVSWSWKLLREIRTRPTTPTLGNRPSAAALAA